MWRGVIHHYKQYLPVTENTPIITLQEGNTPLIYSEYLSQQLGSGFSVYLKFEGANPTGSFKDRGMTMAVSKAVEEGSQAVICASTGNTSASAAAYAARANLKCAVLIPKGAIAMGKLVQALSHGAIVIAVDGNFDICLNLVREITQKYPITLVNSINPYRIEGQKTGAFEICDVLGDAPDFHLMPVGNAGNITAYWKGYKQYYELKKITRLPKMIGFQAEGAAPIVRGHPVENPQTIATAIRIGNPASWKKAVKARDESGGLITTVSDDEIVSAYKLLPAKEGIFVEPASAASVAGLLKLKTQGFFSQYKGGKIVCILTGHGLKDPDLAIKVANEPVYVQPDLDQIVKIIGI
ncbi:MAG: threonine synthase [Candidatus Omnitrophica bacterium 4484_49]|nr:MAG: threonine synthase [Candidatus Omnitrophica bacterium 4484_49]